MSGAGESDTTPRRRTPRSSGSSGGGARSKIWPFVLLGAIAAFVVGAVALERARNDDAPAAAFVDAASAFTATSPDDDGSVWFCPGGTGIDDGLADVTVVLANPTDVAIEATLYVVAEGGGSAEASRVVDPGARVDVRLGAVLESRRVAARVEADRGGLVAEQVLRSPRGTASVPCAADTSSTWYFADGATIRGARTQVWLTNPYAEPALVDLGFLTDIGPSRPRALQGLTVPAQGLRVVEIGDQVRRREGVATTVTARVGRVVASQLITYDGTEGARGLTMVTGSPVTSDLWMFPAGRIEEGREEQYVLANPDPETDVQATVSVLGPDGEELVSFDVDVLAESRIEVPIATEELADVPRYAVIVTSEDGFGLVAQRSAFGVAPAIVRGLTGTLGAADGATRWLLAAGGTSADREERIVVFNPTDATANVSISRLGGDAFAIGVDGVDRATIVPFGWREVRLGRYVDAMSLAIEVSSDVPVVVERVEHAVADRGPAVVTAEDVATEYVVDEPLTDAGDPADTVAAVDGGVVGSEGTAEPPDSEADSEVDSGSESTTARAAGSGGGRLGAAIEPIPARAATTAPATSRAPTTTRRRTTTTRVRTSTTTRVRTSTTTRVRASATTEGSVTTRARATTVPSSTAGASGDTTSVGVSAGAAVTSTTRRVIVSSTSSSTTSSTTTSSTSTTTTTTTIPVGGQVALGPPTAGAFGASSSIGVRLAER